MACTPFSQLAKSHFALERNRLNARSHPVHFIDNNFSTRDIEEGSFTLTSFPKYPEWVADIRNQATLDNMPPLSHHLAA
jgi:hypothetical protein